MNSLSLKGRVWTPSLSSHSSHVSRTQLWSFHQQKLWISQNTEQAHTIRSRFFISFLTCGAATFLPTAPDIPHASRPPVSLEKGDREKADKGRSSKLAQRTVRSRSGDNGKNWMYWWERERFRRQETQSREKVLVLLLGEPFVGSRVARTSDRDYVGSIPPSTCGWSS